ncbi:YciI family protein [Noviherbaspirillum massiliense]|uniref:YciI family protein n=1 Tax=Noviherbaspirillum massiliense TaxID=1465823 RepID=UPI0002F549A8|nr:YciI family protein [Noviherbaspirillum massiliense]
MFVILLNYVKPLEDIDRVIAPHRAFLERHYASGHFLLSGRQEPRTGGVIIAAAKDRAEVEAIVRQDPFHEAGVAEYTIVEFLPTMAAEALSAFRVSA